MAANPPSGSQPLLRPGLDPLPAGYGTFFADYVANYGDKYDFAVVKSAFFLPTTLPNTLPNTYIVYMIT